MDFMITPTSFYLGHNIASIIGLILDDSKFIFMVNAPHPGRWSAEGGPSSYYADPGITLSVMLSGKIMDLGRFGTASKTWKIGCGTL
jgi:hypothetical protein